jgi:hypothetical protein
MKHWAAVMHEALVSGAEVEALVDVHRHLLPRRPAPTPGRYGVGVDAWSFALLGLVKGECETWACAFRSGN